jgi:hypothetical protein
VGRSHSQTKTASGACSVTVSDEISGDLRGLLDAEFDSRRKKDNETTAKLEAEQRGCTVIEAQAILEGLRLRGILDKRRAGRVVFYFKKV